MNINLQKITDEIPAIQLSVRVRLAKYGQADNARDTAEALTTLSDALRLCSQPDRGISLDLRGAQRLNEPYRKAIVTLAKDVLKKNQIGLDIRTDKNPCRDVKSLVKVLKPLIANSTSVRIKKQWITQTMSLFSWVSYLGGLALVFVGLNLDTNKVQSKWLAGVPPTLIIGLIMILIGALPQISQYLAVFVKRRNSGGTQ